MGGNRNFICNEHGQEILDSPKYFDMPIVMARDLRKISLYQFSGAPVYHCETHENIVGLSLYLRTNIAPDTMKHSFGLIKNVNGRLEWIYDLCVYPKHQRSHVDKKSKQVFYGPHAHCLSDAYRVPFDYEIQEWEMWFNLFAKNINLRIDSSDIMAPLAGELLL